MRNGSLFDGLRLDMQSKLVRLSQVLEIVVSVALEGWRGDVLLVLGRIVLGSRRGTCLSLVFRCRTYSHVIVARPPLHGLSMV